MKGLDRFDLLYPASVKKVLSSTFFLFSLASPMAVVHVKWSYPEYSWVQLRFQVAY